MKNVSNKFSDVDELLNCKRFVRLYMHGLVRAVEKEKEKRKGGGL